jgi:aminopeptidase-like protein
MKDTESIGGPRMMELIEGLFPICRSITGDGVRKTLAAVQDWLPLAIREVPTGTRVFDWTVPKEWNIRDAYIADVRGRRVVDFRQSNLHVLNYSTPIKARVARDVLLQHVYSLPEQPELIPYRTSYYSENWGFCLTENQRRMLTEDEYDVCIDSSLGNGYLTYGECVLAGKVEDEVLFYTHVCHPSLCNDNLTGIAVTAALGRWLAERGNPRYTYRLVFGPGTIGSITWLSENRDRLGRIRHGLSLGLLGDAAGHTYKRTRSGAERIDQVVEYVLEQRGKPHRVVDFSPYGYDERQFGSPGIRLPVGRLTRSENGGYPEYHTSADNIDLIAEERLSDSLAVLQEIVEVLEADIHYVNTEPYCEPQLGRRGLYRATGGTNIEHRESAMLWLLNQSDGEQSILDIARRSNIGVQSLAAVAIELERAGLLKKN